MKIIVAIVQKESHLKGGNWLIFIACNWIRYQQQFVSCSFQMHHKINQLTANLVCRHLYALFGPESFFSNQMGNMVGKQRETIWRVREKKNDGTTKHIIINATNAINFISTYHQLAYANPIETVISSVNVINGGT